MNARILTALLAATLSIAGCGGGGGASSPTTPTPPVVVPPVVVPPVVTTPPPTVTLALNQTKITLGSSATLTWSSTNATSCIASGAWGGVQAISGTSVQTPAASGPLTYTLTCTGEGGKAVQSAALIVPIKVEKSSYENKAVAAEAIGAQKLPAEVAAGNAVAFADFFQDGTYSMVTHSLDYSAEDPKTATKFGRIHFWQKVNGAWVDNTPKLLTDNSGCLHPRKAVVADFNNSGRPSIFFACHGFDAPPFAGESPHLLLSQADGTYKNVTLPVTCFCHSASAADVNGDSYPDILVADATVKQAPFFLINGKDGTFATDLKRMPLSAANKPIFTAELIDFARTGKYDAFLGGHEQDPSGQWPATILPNDGAGGFASTKSIVLPSLPGYGFPTDIVYKGSSIYLARTIDLSTNFYNAAAIQKIAYPSLASQTLYNHAGAYPSGARWINWLIPTGANIATMDSTYEVSVPQ